MLAIIAQEIFDGMIHKELQVTHSVYLKFLLLNRPELTRSNADVILVDEAQDLNPVEPCALDSCFVDGLHMGDVCQHLCVIV